MLSKRAFLVSVVACLTVALAVMGWSHCHNSSTCEEVIDELVGSHYWDAMPIKYLVNPDWDNKPHMLEDAKASAAAWTRIPYQNKNINFKLKFESETSKSPGKKDKKNVVGYGPLKPKADGTIRMGICINYPKSHYLIGESDIVINYRPNWGTHAENNSSKFCLRNTLTHEFGHFLRLEDLYDWHNCPDYEDYTMWGENPGAGQHGRESLACEDKWVAQYMYGYETQEGD